MHWAVWRRDTLASICMALLACVSLGLACVAMLGALEREQHRIVSKHIQGTLDTMTQLVGLLQQDAITRVRTVAVDPTHLALFEKLVQSPQDKPLLAAYESWLTPIYRSRGFEGYSLISPDARIIVAASSPGYVGKTVSTAASHDALLQAQRFGVGSGRPTPAPRPFLRDGMEQPAGSAYQNTCARIDRGSTLLGYLCLRENPQLRLFRMLQTNQVGETSEAYVVDAGGRILSPVASHSSHTVAEFLLSARSPSPSRVGVGPLTRVVSAMLASRGSSGVLVDYPDYRGVRVVGAAQWLPASDMGIVVEEDLDEAFGPYLFARNVVELMAIIAMALIIGLNYAQWRSRRHLARSEGMMVAFRDNIPAGFHIKSLDGRYLMINPLCEAELKVPASLALGRTDAELFPGQPELQRHEEHDAVVNSGEALISTRHCQGEHGSEQIYRVVRFPIRDAGKRNVIAVGAAAIDITEQVRAQRQLEELARTLEEKVAERTRELAAARDQAEAAGNAKAEFLANMSHEIRTPLNAIIGMTHLALQQPAVPQLRFQLQQVKASSRHLLHIVNNILDLSRMDAGKLPIDVAEFSLEKLLEHVAGLVWVSADAKGLQLSIDIEPGIPDHLSGDAMRIGQVLINFANNAVKFTVQGRVILRVRCLFRLHGQLHLRFEVEDTGPGIAPAQVARLFAPFQQLDNSATRSFEGTGLGLAISKKLAELMGGHVAVSSEEGKGSIFVLEVELQASQAPRPAHAAAGEHIGSALLAMADGELRQRLASRLASLGLRVDEVDSTAQAARQLTQAVRRDAGYAMLLLDAGLPELEPQLSEVLRPTLLRHGGSLVLLGEPAGNLPAGEWWLPLDPDDSALFELCCNTLQYYQASTPDNGWPQLQGRHVLLVEDNTINQELVCGLLAQVGVRVTVAGSGEEALQRLEGPPFDGVLMDVHMPGMNGFVTTARIRSDPRFASLPIVALTARALEGDRACCLAAGMNDYLTKPLEPPLLFDTLQRCFDELAPAHGKAEAVVGQDLDALASMTGIDIQQGLACTMGSADLYTRLLARVVGERAGLATQLQQAYCDGQWQQIEDLLHTGRSILGAIGASQLQQSCREMEQLLQQPERLEPMLLHFVDDYSAMIQDCRRWLAAHHAGGV
ncbi:ATP-binding protein [Vogesella sp. LIG4]|uniref:ATP-binding protein n=1 Tax=Vogesella sp. LIG4 TaxID=1192162 RepID=UPI00081F8916|nr:ATP-binding protein [Vogesella sp. LIG4]SCK29332.1 hypothetical protein PSELUDRAFT_3609 [Vogesella sp. LIG4]